MAARSLSLAPVQYGANCMGDQMTYDNWKCTDPNDQFLGPDPMDEYIVPETTLKAWESFKNGDLTLGGMGEELLEQGFSPAEVRILLSKHIKYPISIGYFGEE